MTVFIVVLWLVLFLILPIAVTWYAAYRVVKDEDSRWVWAAVPVLLYWAGFFWQFHQNMMRWWG